MELEDIPNEVFLEDIRDLTQAFPLEFPRQFVGRWLFLHWDDWRQKTAENFIRCGFERSWCEKKLAPAFALV